MTNNSSPHSEFDGYAEGYDTALAQGLSVSGEDKYYFARGRIAWLANYLGQQKWQPKSILDFGCGTGSTVPLFFDLLQVETVIGTDDSARSLAVAKQSYGSKHVQFLLLDQYQPREEIDLAYCNGVLHYIPPNKRASAIECIYRSLRPGGLFALWENNPWNPATRYVMSRIPFDRDAIPLSSSGTRRLLREGGFEILRTDFLFIFPRFLSWFRGLESFVSRLPLGTQYQVLCRKP